MEPYKDKLQICSVNVRGLQGPRMLAKTKAICNLFQNTNSNLTFLLDTHLDSDTQNNILKYWKGTCLFANSNQNSYVAGIALLSKNIDMSNSSFIPDENGRFAILKVTISNQNYLIIAIYAPTHATKQSKQQFYDSLNSKIKGIHQQSDIVVMLGDFNSVENEKLDKSTGSNNDNSYKFLNPLLLDFDLEDIWRSRNPNRREFTFTSSQGYSSRIDRIYVSQNATHSVINVDHKSFAHSDHSSVHVSLAIKGNATSGTKTWCLNKNLLSDKDYITKITALWSNWQVKKSQFPDVLQWWDKGKQAIKNLSIEYSRKKSKIQNKIIKSLYKRLRNAENQNKTNLITEIKEKIQNIEIRRAKNHFLTQKYTWIDEGPAGPEFIREHKQNINNINVVSDDVGNVFTDQQTITSMFAKFYENLYSEIPTYSKTQNELLSDFRKKASPEKKEEADSEITKEDLKKALFQLPNDKSPGKDGLPVDFYKCFWDVIGDEFHTVCIKALETGLLPNSQRTAIIKCLPKKGDLTKIGNWRPISLLNADYKILSKTIANRVSIILPEVISENQTCSIKGRKIRQNLLIIRDFVEFSNEHQLPACLISLDQTKAFDRVNWKFLFKILKQMNFGKRLISWISTLYHKISSCVKINGLLSGDFAIHQGVRQGCPLSPLLYVILAEILNHTVNADPLIKGIRIDGTETKLTQYADDTAALLIDDRSIYALFNNLERYQKASGSKINLKKTEALWLGSNAGRQDTPVNLAWTSDSVNILGLPFGNSDITPTLWENNFKSIQKTLNKWEKYNLSLRSKVQVIKTLIVPILLYPSQIYPMNKKQIARMRSMAEGFLWSNKSPKIPTALLQFPIHLGGLALPNFENFTKAILLTWIKDIFTDNNPVWKKFFLFFTNFFHDLFFYENIFRITLKAKAISQSKIPAFYKAILKAWQEFTKNERVPITDPVLMRLEPIFHNIFLQNRIPPTWYHKNERKLSRVGHLVYDWIPRFMSYDQVTHYHDIKITKYSYEQVIKSIPPEWEKTINENYTNPIPDSTLNVWKRTGEKTPKSTAIADFSCKLFYKELNNFSIESSKALVSQNKTPHFSEWEVKANNINWKKIFKYLNENNIDRKTVEVQYRLLHFSTWTRVKLFQTKLSPSPICPRCLQKNEDIEHLFIFCTKTRIIWQKAVTQMRAVCPQLQIKNIYKAIVIGFADHQKLQKYINVLEDIRLAFFKATWVQQNQAVQNFVILDGPTLFNKYMKNYIKLRIENYNINETYTQLLFNYGFDFQFQ